MYILGIDQGIANCGYAIIHKDKHIESGTIKTKAQLNDGARLNIIKKELITLIEKYKIEAIVCESIFFNSGARGRNKSASQFHPVKVIALLNMIADDYNIEMTQYAPMTVKKELTGTGKATKEEMIDTVNTMFNLDLTKTKEHQADAIAIAYCYLQKEVLLTA